MESIISMVTAGRQQALPLKTLGLVRTGAGNEAAAEKPSQLFSWKKQSKATFLNQWAATGSSLEI